MVNRFFYRDKPIFGLEVSQTGLRIMSIDPKHHRISGYGSIDVDPTKLEESLTKDGDFLTKSIASLLHEHITGHLPSNRLVISVPTVHSFTRSLLLPAKNEDHLLEAIELESEQYIPVPVNDLNIDFEIIGRNKDLIEVLMCATPKNIVNNIVKAAYANNLEPIAVEPAINSIARLIMHTEEGHLASIIVDIGAASTDIAILDKTIRVTGSVPIGSHSFTLAIAKNLQISLETAHQLKIHDGLNPGPKQDRLKAALEPLLAQIASEIRKVIRYYAERISSKTKIEQVVISGNGSNLPGIGDYMTNALLLPSRVANPWHTIAFDKLPTPPVQLKSRFVTVAGLALVNPKGVWI